MSLSILQATPRRGAWSFGIPNPLEVELAELICQWMPSIDKVRMVNSGTEAAMSCIRLARGFTGRDKIIKFDGCYHGHADSLLVKAGSGALTFGHPDSAGVPASFAELTIVAALQRHRSCPESALRGQNKKSPCIILRAGARQTPDFIYHKNFL